MYDPFYWYERELDREYEEEQMANKIEIDLEAITKRRDELMDLSARYNFELKQVEKEMESLDLQLIALLNQTGTEEMQYGNYSFGWKTTKRTALDQKYLKEHFADIAKQCTFTKENRVFDFKLGGV
ncbi:MAG: hypothetical protein IKY45_03800 [Clostridia bacterium]|nr:hypothetical protein [Clostridia bacterium]MBR4973570.1 hypothetical protein [Clostridia bacterium]